MAADRQWERELAELAEEQRRAKTRADRVQAALFAVLILLIAVLLFGGHAHADTVIPRAALQYRSELTRAAHAFWGLDAPVATFGAQIQTESWWKPGTVSSAGAQGLAQFLPSTAKWLPSVIPAVGSAAPFDPRWSLRACVAYDKWLFDRVDGATGCDRMAFALSAYNGGLGWVRRDMKKAAALGFDSRRWWGEVENANAGRRASAFRENRTYVRRILHDFEPAYVRAGWGTGACRAD